MKTKVLSTFLIIAVAAAAILSLGSCSKDDGERVSVVGSTTVLPITQIAAEKFREKTGISVSIEGSGSGNGIRAVIDGTCDIGNSSRAMRPGEIENAETNNVEVKEIVVALDMIVPILHPSNPVNNLTVNQLKAIYDGSIRNWKEVGGKDENITIISRDTSSGTYEVWNELILKGSDVAARAQLQASNGSVLSAVAGNPRAIGYVGYGYLNDSIKPINVNGINPTIENGRSGKFPVSRELYKYVNANNITEQTQKFLDFILGPEGQKLVEEAGFLPVK